MERPRKNWSLIAAIVGAATLGFLVSHHFATRAPPPLPATTGAAVTVPAVRPVFSLGDATGQIRSITEWDGRSLVVNFWATWCPPCRREIPLLNALQRENAGAGFQVIGVAVDLRESVLGYLKKTPVDYPVLIGEQDALDAAKAFGVATTGFPFTVFTDRAGNIVTVFVGELHREEATVILRAVTDINAGRTTPSQARPRIEEELDAIRRSKRSRG